MFKNYEECKKEAQQKANDTGADYGIEKNTLFNEWRYFRLPATKRHGHELHCEVVMCDDWGKRQRYLGL